MKYYSVTTQGFYDDAVHGDAMPADAIGIGDEEYAVLLHGLSTGAAVGISQSGRPELVAPPPPTLEQAQERMMAELAEYRWKIETAGVYAGGIQVATDRESQAMLTGALNTLRSGYVSAVDWKGNNGWITLSLAQVEGVAQIVAGHVQDCFRRERQVSQTIMTMQDAGAVLAIDLDAAWAAAN